MLVNRHNDPNRGASQDGDPKNSKPVQAQPLPPEVQSVLDVEAAKVAVEEVQMNKPAKVEKETPSTTELLITLIEKLGKSIDAQTEIATRAGKKDLEEEIRRETKRAKYAENRGDDTQAVIRKQASCLHLKGGKFRNIAVTDYAVIFHLFIDSTCFIKCVLCKMKWYPTDTIDTIFRGGVAHPNHTHIGWFEAAKMMQQSTNKGSRSELAGTPAPYTEATKHLIPDTLGVITTPGA
jgi:hypothetical protein